MSTGRRSAASTPAACPKGDIYVVKAGPVFELLATNRMGAPVLATPAISEGRLFVRTQSHLMAFGG